MDRPTLSGELWPVMPYLPEDIRPQWLNVIRRLQSVAKSGHDGNAMITVSVLVDQDGYPVSWTEPRRDPMEPKRMAEQALEALGAVGTKAKQKT